MALVKTEPGSLDTEVKNILEECQEARMPQETRKAVIDTVTNLEWKSCWCRRITMWTSPGATLCCGASCAATNQTGHWFYKTSRLQDNLLVAAIKCPTRLAEVTYVVNASGHNKIVAIKPFELAGEQSDEPPRDNDFNGAASGGGIADRAEVDQLDNMEIQPLLNELVPDLALIMQGKCLRERGE